MSNLRLEFSVSNLRLALWRARGQRASVLTLEELAEQTGVAWARAQIADMRAERRGVRGGFPGTMREARTQVEVSLRRDHTTATQLETDAAVRLAYSAARRTWLSSREGPDEGHTIETTESHPQSKPHRGDR